MALAWALLPWSAQAETYFVIVSGIGGEERYERAFDSTVNAWSQAAARVVSAPDRIVRLSGDAATRDALRTKLGALKKRLTASDDLVLALVGHGSFDGDHYKFNLPGPDITAEEIAALLQALPARRQLIVNTTSASGASAEVLRAAERTVVTATRSGVERNATVFGEYWVRALQDPSADLDKDGWISAREAFDHTQAAVAEHYARAVQLATEHPRIEEAAQGSGFRVARLAAATASSDLRANARRDGLLHSIDALRARKPELEAAAYYRALEELLIELARLDLQSETTDPSEPGRAP